MHAGGFSASLHQDGAAPGFGGGPQQPLTVFDVPLPPRDGLRNADTQPLFWRSKPRPRHERGDLQQLLSWHPLRPMLALILPDDSLRFFHAEPQNPRWEERIVLTHEFMRGSRCVAWAPLSEVVAVGCSHGTCLWRLSSENTGWMTFLQHPNRKSVQHLAWAPHGRHLATVAEGESNVLVWDVATRSAVPLHTRHLGPPATLDWSPDGLYLLATFRGEGFAVWETRRWSMEEWSFGGRCTAAAWSPFGNSIAVAMEATQADLQPVFIGTVLASSDMAADFEIDFRSVALPRSTDAPSEILNAASGNVTQLSWSVDGSLLFASFKDQAVKWLAAYQIRQEPSIRVSLTMSHLLDSEPAQRDTGTVQRFSVSSTEQCPLIIAAFSSDAQRLSLFYAS